MCASDETSGGYLHGCWKDEEDRAMKGKDLGRLSKESPRDCITACAHSGFKFAGVEDKDHCFCDNNPPTKGRALMQECTPRPCEDGARCGGEWRISLYTTSKHEGVHRNVKSGNYREFLIGSPRDA
eukprot:GHVU01057472.1.p1 GENE.GHVU01057472.1~~GHVU01057472.1.p1  ORF type:complete len:126 (+),score=11.12 GHVU01057472.1:430-807(+)